MKMKMFLFTTIAACLCVAMLSGCEKQPGDGKVHITYWEKWTGAEAEAMQRVVDEFNASQNKIVVEYLSVSNVDRKTIIATAGGDPPDVAGIWVHNLYSFADAAALMPLDEFMRRDGKSTADWLARYYPVYADMCEYRGKIWGVPSTPTTIALHWNKTLFREAGLDPERPPRTVQELDEFAKKLTKRDPATGKIVQIGFLPQDPGWWAWAFPLWFGGQLWDGKEIKLGGNSENLEGFRWVAECTRREGAADTSTFASGFGQPSSPQAAFYTAKIAMVFQGVWLNSYIHQYAPGLDYGCAPWPTAKPGLENFTVAEADFLSIPRSAKHPNEAWEFIKYISSMNPTAQSHAELRGMESLCFGQEKNSPLRTWSPFFEQHHPHPYVSVFRKLAESPNAVHVPKIGIWTEYGREITNLFERVYLLQVTPEDGIGFAQERVAESWLWHERGIERREKRVGAR